MIWLTWRQLRGQAIALCGGVAALAVALALTGPHLAGMSRTDGAGFLNDLSGLYSGLYLLGTLSVLALPALVGMFLGYAAFAFVLGAAIGMLVRRTLPAMAVLLAAFIATQVIMTTAVRPHLFSPVAATVAITSSDLTFIGISGNVSVAVPEPGAWITAQHTIDAAGQPAKAPSWIMDCPGKSPGSQDQTCYTRLARLGYRQEVSYQPSSRFWPLQAAETAIYLALAAALTAVCAWRLRRLS